MRGKNGVRPPWSKNSIKTCSGISLSKVGCSTMATPHSLTTAVSADVNRLAAFEKMSLLVNPLIRMGRASGW